MPGSRKKKNAISTPAGQRRDIGPAPTSDKSGRAWLGLVVLLVILVLAGWRLLPDRAAEAGPDAAARQARDAASSDQEDRLSSTTAAAASEQVQPLPALKNQFADPELEQRRGTLDPAVDGWESEVFHDRANSQLAALGALLKDARPLTASALAGIVHPEFDTVSLRPQELEDAYAYGGLTVRRAVALPAAQRLATRGPQALADALGPLHSVLSAREPHVKLKQFKVKLSSATAAETTVYFRADARDDHGARQLNATWQCRWTRGEPAPLLRSITLSAYEEIQAAPGGGGSFSDCTAAVVGGNPSFKQQLSAGLNHWLQRVDRVHGMYLFARNGVAVGDVNGDGLDDVYVCQAGGLPNRLFVQQLDGTALDVSAAGGVDFLDHSSSALFLDLDNDGDQDLVVAIMAGVVVLEGDGSGGFTTVAQLATADRDVQSLTAADFDLDGDVDLYLCLDFAQPGARPGEQSPNFLYHDANDGGANVLFRNDGDWRFSDVTKAVGLDVDNRRHSLAAAWTDYDNDGDEDLYVANDYGRNCLYRNNGGRFENVAASAGVVDYGSGMSASWGDYDRDGHMDLYVGNMFSGAGNRIAVQEQFHIAHADDPGARELYSRFAKGNSLFRNTGDGQFHDSGQAAGVEVAGWAWSSIFVDVNNDGWEDLLVGNGYITTEDTGDL